MPLLIEKILDREPFCRAWLVTFRLERGVERHDQQSGEEARDDEDCKPRARAPNVRRENEQQDTDGHEQPVPPGPAQVADLVQ